MKKRTKRPNGIAPIWTEDLGDTVSYCYFLLQRQIREVVNDDGTSWKPNSVIGYLRVLRVIIEAHPIWPRNSCFERDEFQQWKQFVETHLGKVSLGVPANYREEFRAAVEDDLAYIEEFLERKRDPKRDVR